MVSNRGGRVPRSGPSFKLIVNILAAWLQRQARVADPAAPPSPQSMGVSATGLAIEVPLPCLARHTNTKYSGTANGAKTETTSISEAVL